MKTKWFKSSSLDNAIEGEYLIDNRSIKIIYFNGEGVREKIQTRIENIVVGCLQNENKIIEEIANYFVNLYNESWSNEFIDDEEYKSLTSEKFISLVSIESFDCYGLNENLNIYFNIQDDVYFGRNFLCAVVNDNLEIFDCSI